MTVGASEATQHFITARPPAQPLRPKKLEELHSTQHWLLWAWSYVARELYRPN